MMVGEVLPSPDNILSDDDIGEPVYGDSVYTFFNEVDRGEIARPVVTGRTQEGKIVLSDDAKVDNLNATTQEVARERITELDARMSRGLSPEQNLTNLTIQDPVPVTKSSDLVDGSDSVMTNMRDSELPVVRTTLTVIEQDRMLEIFNPGHPNEDPESHSRVVSSNWANWQFQKRIPIFDELFEDSSTDVPDIPPPPLESTQSYEISKEHAAEMERTNELPNVADATANAVGISAKPLDAEASVSYVETNSPSRMNTRSGSFRRIRKLPPKPEESNVQLEKAINNE